VIQAYAAFADVLQATLPHTLTEVVGEMRRDAH
jgi:hypothetical protein